MYRQVGAVLNNKEGSPYLQFNQDVIIPAGTILALQRPKDQIDFLVEKKHISQEEGEKRLAKIPDYVRFNVLKKDGNEKKAKKAEGTKDAENF
jgi:hypothetical protein